MKSSTPKISVDYKDKIKRELLKENTKKFLNELIFGFLEDFIKNSETINIFLYREKCYETQYNKYKELAEEKLSEYAKKIKAGKNNRVILLDLKKCLIKYWEELTKKKFCKKKIQINIIGKDFVNIAILVIFKEIDNVIFKVNSRYTKAWEIIEEIDVIKSYLALRRELLYDYWSFDENILRKSKKDYSPKNYAGNFENCLSKLRIELKKLSLTSKDLRILQSSTKSILKEAKFLRKQLDSTDWVLSFSYIVAEEKLSGLFNQVIHECKQAEKQAKNLILVCKKFVNKNISGDYILDFDHDQLENKINLGVCVTEKLINYCGTSLFLLDRANKLKYR